MHCHQSDSDSSGDSMDHPPVMKSTMESPNHPGQRNSKEDPPDLLEEFIRLYQRDHRELKECIESLRRLINTFEEDFRRATECNRDGGIVGIVGGVIMITGLALAPFTLRASALVSGAGAAMAFGGGISSGILNFMKMNQQKKLRENVKNRLDKFQNKVIPMTNIMEVMCQYTNEILSDLNKPEHNISGFSKYIASASEVVRLIRIDGIGEVAAQMSKTVRLTATLTGVFAGVGLVLNILSVIKDNKALDDMDNLAKKGQISESEIKSEAGKFIVETRKVICDLQNIMDDLKETKDRFVNEMDLTRQSLTT